MSYSKVKGVIRDIPVVGAVAVGVSHRLRHWLLWRSFPGSAADWRRHYEHGGGSGYGSYGRLAEFKAEVLNRFVADERIGSVVEFGCGDGNQLGLARYPRYLGFDIARGAIERCRQRFAGDDSKSFLLYDPHAFIDPAGFIEAEMAISLDLVFHLVEDELFELHMRHLFGAATRFVVVYSSDRDERTGHPGIRHRKWTSWVAANIPAWTLREVIPNRYPYEGDSQLGSFSDFFIYQR